MLGGSMVLLFIGMPMALTFIAINIVGAWICMGGEPGLVQLARSSVSSVTAFSLTPVHLFVLMGEVLLHTALALKVIKGVERLIRRVPGRLAVVAGTVFSAVWGSTTATTPPGSVFGRRQRPCCVLGKLFISYVHYTCTIHV